MPESYQPGARQPKFGKNHQVTESRYAWVITESGKFLILVGNDEGSGEDVVLYGPRPGRISDISISLTNLTEAELDALETLFKTAFEWARPVVMRRDKEAQDAWDAGDDSYTRNYRGLPTVVYRKRPSLEYSEGLRERPEGVLEGDGGSGGSVGVRGTGSELVEPDSEGSVSEDDGETAD